MLALSDAAWTSIATIVTSVITLIVVVITHGKVTSIESKIDSSIMKLFDPKKDTTQKSG